MPLASSSYSFPLLGAFWTIFMIFLWVIWIWVLIRVFIDIFRSRDLSGWAKALADLRDRGVISAGEFESQKAKVLAA